MLWMDRRIHCYESLQTPHLYRCPGPPLSLELECPQTGSKGTLLQRALVCICREPGKKGKSFRMEKLSCLTHINSGLQHDIVHNIIIFGSQHVIKYYGVQIKTESIAVSHRNFTLCFSSRSCERRVVLRFILIVESCLAEFHLLIPTRRYA